jgi:predicted dehydrogenase
MKKSDQVTRRKFIQGGSALLTASTFTIVNAKSVRGTAANSMVEIGWVGLGGQGTRDAYLLEKTGKAKIVGVADYFQYRVDNALKPLQPGQQRPDLGGLDKKNAHVGEQAYKAIMSSNVDAVLLVTPPGFRPEHFRAAVAAKKHVFMEKPIAVDVAGCHQIEEIHKSVVAQKLSVVVGLQRHYSKAYRACKKLVDEGAIGDIAIAHSAWDQGDLWKDRRAKYDKSKWPTQRDYEVEHWYYFKWLSGDHIVEQNIHNIDVINWFLGAHPVRAYGSGSRLKRKEIGDIYDNFNIVYEYASGVTSNNTCIQIDGTRGDVSETIRGTKGTFTTTAGKGGTGGARLESTGKNAGTIYEYKTSRADGVTDDLHYDQEAETFVASVLGQGEFRDDTMYGMESTMTAILGREAVYRKEILEWTKFWNSKHKLSFNPKSEA